MTRLDQPKPSWLAHRNVGATANNILHTFGVQEAPVDVFGIAKGLGIQVHFIDSPGWDGACQSDEDGNANVWIDASDANTRQRFTMAHEIGHLMCHPLGQIFRDTRKSMMFSSVEAEANAFAADLLMPKHLLLPDYRALDGQVWLLAHRYDVSEHAMSIRVGKLFGV